MPLEKQRLKRTWLRKWKLDDFLAVVLVLLTFFGISTIPAIAKRDYAYRRMRAREDCQILARSIGAVTKSKLRTKGKGGSSGNEATLLHTWNGNMNMADNVEKWPRVSESIRPWRYYTGVRDALPAGFQHVREFLRDLYPNDRREHDLLLKASFIRFDPWGKPYLINIGNMREKEQPEPELSRLTWAISAGPNGKIETPDYMLSESKILDFSDIESLVSGDDIGAIIEGAFNNRRKVKETDDVNPLIVYPEGQGCVVTDSRILLAKGPS